MKLLIKRWEYLKQTKKSKAILNHGRDETAESRKKEITQQMLGQTMLKSKKEIQKHKKKTEEKNK